VAAAATSDELVLVPARAQMVTAGMPELVVINDIKYLSERLQPELGTDPKADQQVRRGAWEGACS
jgi:hypothetical protein